MQECPATGPALEELSMHGCANVIDEVVVAAAGDCPELLHPDVSECRNVTGEGVKAVAEH